MSLLILRTASRYLFPLLLLFSVFLLWRGHHEPGGGFVGGLVAATAFVLIALAEGAPSARERLRLAPERLAVCGVAVATLSGAVGWFLGEPFLTGIWWAASPGESPVVGTPLLFDLGVYLSVIGVVLAFLLTLIEETK